MAGKAASKASPNRVADALAIEPGARIVALWLLLGIHVIGMPQTPLPRIAWIFSDSLDRGLI